MNNYIFSHSEELSIEVLATSILAKKTNIEMCNSLACVAHINSMNQNSIKKKGSPGFRWLSKAYTKFTLRPRSDSQFYESNTSYRVIAVYLAAICQSFIYYDWHITAIGLWCKKRNLKIFQRSIIQWKKLSSLLSLSFSLYNLSTRYFCLIRNMQNKMSW